MFKIILAVMVFTLAACSDNSNKSSADNQSKVDETVEGETLSQISGFSFIVDASLRDCLDKSGMTVESLHTLVCAGKGVKSLDGIEQLPALKNLNLSHNEVSDIAPLASVKSLQVFYATNNKIESVDALSAMPELSAISLRSNQLTDGEVFYTLPQLEKLYVQGNSDLDLDATKLSADVIVAI